MKVYDIISESVEVDEAPMGFMSKIGNKLKSKIPGEIGSRAAGSLEAGTEANSVKKELAGYMGRAGIAKGQLTMQAFMTFMTQKGYGDNIKAIAKSIRAPGTPANAPLKNDEVDQMVRKAVSGAAGAATTVKRGTFAGTPKKNAIGNPASANTKGLPPQIVSAVGSMTPQQKAALAAMLGSNP
jgi:hypothetical protein